MLAAFSLAMLLLFLDGLATLVEAPRINLFVVRTVQFEATIIVFAVVWLGWAALPFPGVSYGGYVLVGSAFVFVMLVVWIITSVNTRLAEDPK